VAIRPSDFPMRSWGLPEAGELERVVIVSPHLDDAVLGCGRFMAAHPGVTVVTVFAGNPPVYPDPMRVWDVQSGFAPGDDVMEARRTEDAAALGVLDASPVHLDFVEHTYNPGDRPVAPAELADGLAPALAAIGPSVVLVPFGLANPDHDVTHRACLLARERLADDVSGWSYEESEAPQSRRRVCWWLYEDFGYKSIPGLLAWRVASLFRKKLWPTPVIPPTDADDRRKLEAVNKYPSQLLALEDDWQISAKLTAPEQFWRIEAPPEGWDGLTIE
jgi:LmbE family N-acetylglucosaminyl deacetylase